MHYPNFRLYRLDKTLKNLQKTEEEKEWQVPVPNQSSIIKNQFLLHSTESMWLKKSEKVNRNRGGKTAGPSRILDRLGGQVPRV